MTEDEQLDAPEFDPVPQRPEKIRALAAAANAGMTEEAKTATAAEVFSACLTLCGTMIAVAQDLGAEPAMIRNGVLQLLVRCPEDEGAKVN